MKILATMILIGRCNLLKWLAIATHFSELKLIPITILYHDLVSHSYRELGCYIFASLAMSKRYEQLKFMPASSRDLLHTGLL